MYTTLLCGCNGRQDGLWASLLDYTSRGLGLSPDCALFFGVTFYSHIASFYSGGRVSYRQTLRETLVKAGITNPLQWIFRLVGRFSILDGQKVYHISKSTLWQGFGFLSCGAFGVDMVLHYKLFQTQRAQETPTEQSQGPPQRRAWDINNDFLNSTTFKVKLVEIVSFYYRLR